jgi:hypothetical protein
MNVNRYGGWRVMFAILSSFLMTNLSLAQSTTHKPLSLDDQESTAQRDMGSKMESQSTHEEVGDKMEDLQSFNTYTSLEDGQPGQRGELQINYFSGWQTSSHESDPFLMLMEIEYSPCVKDNWLLSNAKFGIDVPVEMGNGGVDGNGDVHLIWKQRLVEEEEGNWWPTVSIENEVRLPTGDDSSGVDGTMEGTIAKNVGPGTAVFNAFITSANGHNNLEKASWFDEWCYGTDDELRHLQWGFRVGYKWRINECFSLVTDYINQSSELLGESNQNIGEVAAEWRINDHFTVGPGIMIGLDGKDSTPNFGAGLLLHYSWE